MARDYLALENRLSPEWFATSDPAGLKLGSGGGTAHLLTEAWLATRSSGHCSFRQWLVDSRKLIIHGAGDSRRLPAYAPSGRLLMPLPALRWAQGQRIDQTLLDLQLPEYRRVLNHAPPRFPVLIASGDVLLRFGRNLPPFPEVDVLGLGMWVTAEVASQFGVFFCSRHQPDKLAFFLQKPTTARLRELGAEYVFLIDTGMWLLSERALAVLMRCSGWDPDREVFRDGKPNCYELYNHFGLGLGQHPALKEPEINALSATVIPLPQAAFYHFDASRQMIESTSALQHLELDETKLGRMGSKRRPDQYVQNSRFDGPKGLEENRGLWVENSIIPATWKLAHDHVLTGIPANDWDLRLEPGVCLDFVPVGERGWCVRFYGLDDTFDGVLKAPSTSWLSCPAADWFTARQICPEAAGIVSGMNLQQAPLFPVLALKQCEPRFLEWLFKPAPGSQKKFAEKWLSAPRLSAQQIIEKINLRRFYTQREANRKKCLPAMLEDSAWNVFFKLDLESTARLYAATPASLPPTPRPAENCMEPMQWVRARPLCAIAVWLAGSSMNNKRSQPCAN
jgi:hypothetical protein